MDETPDTLSTMSSSDFEDLASKFLSALGYETESISVEQDTLFVKTHSPDHLEKISLFAFYRTKRKVGASALKGLHANLIEGNIPELTVVSLSGFTKEAQQYALRKPIKLIDAENFRSALARNNILSTGLKDKKEVKVMYSSAFALGMSEDEARKYFEGRRQKKLFGFLKPDENIAEFSGHYAPVAAFNMNRIEEIDSGTISRFKKSAERRNTFFVNTSTLELYYVYKGSFINKPSIVVSDILTRIADLSPQELGILSRITEHGKMSIELLNQKYPTYTEDGVNSILHLQARGLIDVSPMKPEFLSTLSLPEFNNDKYNLRAHIATEESIETNYLADAPSHSPEKIVELMKSFFAAEGSFSGITYLPYYQCKFVDSEGLFRYEILIPPKFIKRV